MLACRSPVAVPRGLGARTARPRAGAGTAAGTAAGATRSANACATAHTATSAAATAASGEVCPPLSSSRLLRPQGAKCVRPFHHSALLRPLRRMCVRPSAAPPSRKEGAARRSAFSAPYVSSFFFVLFFFSGLRALGRSVPSRRPGAVPRGGEGRVGRGEAAPAFCLPALFSPPLGVPSLAARGRGARRAAAKKNPHGRLGRVRYRECGGPTALPNQKRTAARRAMVAHSRRRAWTGPAARCRSAAQAFRGRAPEGGGTAHLGRRWLPGVRLLGGGPHRGGGQHRGGGLNVAGARGPPRSGPWRGLSSGLGDGLQGVAGVAADAGAGLPRDARGAGLALLAPGPRAGRPGGAAAPRGRRGQRAGRGRRLGGAAGLAEGRPGRRAPRARRALRPGGGDCSPAALLKHLLPSPWIEPFSPAGNGRKTAPLKRLLPSPSPAPPSISDTQACLSTSSHLPARAAF